MVAGRKPKPTRLKIIEGNPGRRPLNTKEPRPRLGRPTCPAWLLPEAKREWRRVVPELEALGMLTAIDRASLSAYCQSWGRMVEAEEQVNRYGSILKSKNSDYVQVSPYETLRRHNAQAVRAFATEFGLTPSSRSRLSLTPPIDDEERKRMLD